VLEHVEASAHQPLDEVLRSNVDAAIPSDVDLVEVPRPSATHLLGEADDCVVDPECHGVGNADFNAELENADDGAHCRAPLR